MRTKHLTKSRRVYTPMKLLFYRYGSICEPDIILGFKELGFDVSEITEEITNKSVSPQKCIQLVSNFLLNHPVDFVFTVNFYPSISEVCNIFHLRYLCWIVDSPVMELYTSSIQNPWNRVFLFDKCLYHEISRFNPKCVFYLPLATNITQKNLLLSSTSESIVHSFSAKVSFIGSLYTEKCAYDRLSPQAPSYLQGYLNGLMESQLHIYGYYFIEELLPDSIIQDFISNFPHFYHLPGENFLSDRTTLAQLYIGTKITVMERDRIMHFLSERYPVTIYTGSNTTAYPKLINKGFAKSETEMPIIFHSSDINLNITAKSIRSGLPLRIWDILGSCGFCLTNYQTELSELLNIGTHLDTYSSFDELDEKIHFYLNHPSIRKEIAQTGYEEIKNHHTYPIRLAQMITLAYQ